MEDIKSQLAAELADIDWACLIPHAQRDAIIFVNQSLNLLDVGIAIAEDNVSLVQSWISQQLIHKPLAEQLGEWNLTPDQHFHTLIVQPFVLIKEIKK